MSKNVLIYGGRGALGNVVLETFKKAGWWTMNVDLNSHESADVNILVENTDSWITQSEKVCKDVGVSLGDRKLQAILCVAGGFGMANIANKDVVKTCDLMWKQSVWSSIIASHIATKYGAPNGLLVLTGAKPALGATPALIGYGMAKAAVHQLVSSLASGKNGLPENTSTVAILPITLDTPGNRAAMPKADTSTWTPLQFVADTMIGWAAGDNAVERPASGSLIILQTTDGNTKLVINNEQK